CAESSCRASSDLRVPGLPGRRGCPARGGDRRAPLERGRDGRLDSRGRRGALLPRRRPLPRAVPPHVRRAVPPAGRRHRARGPVRDDVPRPAAPARLARPCRRVLRLGPRAHPARAPDAGPQGRAAAAGHLAGRARVRPLRARMVGPAGRRRRHRSGHPSRAPRGRPRLTARSSRLAGYLFALAAGAVWGTTGPLSTALYRAGEAITGIGFWRLAIGFAGLLVYGLFRPWLFRIDRRAWLLVGLGGGALVALFEVAYQFGIAGTGVAGAAALLYIAPVLVAILAKPLLGEQLTARRIVLAVVVMAGAALTVQGGSHGAGAAAIPLPSLIQGVAGGLLAMLSFAGTTLLARYAVPRYGATQVLFLEILGGVVVLGIVLPVAGHPPLPPHTTGAWMYVLLLSLGSVLAAHFFFFAAVKRIDAALTSVAATIEPVVGALLALLLFKQQLSPLAWLGLTMVVGGVATSYLSEAKTE